MTETPRYQALLRTLIFVFRGQKLLLMKYSGKGEHQTREKADRKDIFNPIGGHIEAGEDIIANAVKEAREEAGITLASPKIRGIINTTGFAGKNVVVFIVVGETGDEPLASTLEGELHWVDLAGVDRLHTFADIRPILDRLLSLEPGQMIVGTSRFEGFDLKSIDLKVV